MRLLTRCLAFSFGTGFLIAPAFAQDLTLVYKETEGGATSSRYYTKDKMRTSSPESDTMVEYASGKITTIDHKKKEYSEFTVAEAEARMKEAAAEMEKQSAQMKQQMEAMPPAVREKMEQMLGGMADSVTVTKGGTRKVAGYDCQEYVIAMGQSMKTNTCNTTALAFPIPEADLRRYMSFASGIATSPMGKGFTKLADKMKEVQGIAIAESSSFSLLGKTKTSGREAVEVKQGPVDPAVFALPAGYKKVPSPFLKGGKG
ncbi:MAG TPA: DUF4412 domain-containing protein [Vicinamibacteria bacterium]